MPRLTPPAVAAMPPLGFAMPNARAVSATDLSRSRWPHLLSLALRWASVGALGIACGVSVFAGPSVAEAATRHARSKKAAPSFPMKAEEYRALMEKRIDAVRAVIDRKLDRRGVSPDRKKQIHKLLDDSSKDLRAEIARVTADGTVTQAEADKVKPIANGLRAKVRERMRAEKTGSDKTEKDAKKDDKPAKEKHGKVDPEKGERPSKVAKADAPKSGKTKSTKAKDDAQASKASKKGSGPTKHADASAETKHDSATKKSKAPAPSGEADL